MTDISKEAVALDLIWLDQLAAEDGVSPAVMLAERYRALSARVEELEATIDGKTYIAGKADGRLQGLDEAIAKGNEAYRDIYAEIDHAGPVAQSAVQRATGATQVLRSIKALKGTKQ